MDTQMTHREIEKIKQELYDIQRLPDSPQQLEPIKRLAGRIPACLPVHPSEEQKDFINETIHNIHIVLQSEMMFNACIFAKRSCFWAAVAAVVSLVSVLMVLFLR
jgi:hypothetical protein